MSDWETLERTGTFMDERGHPLPQERVEKIRTAFAALYELTDHERGLVTCWFCKGCNCFIGPGEHCDCQWDMDKNL